MRTPLLSPAMAGKRRASYLPLLEENSQEEVNPFCNRTMPLTRGQKVKRIFVGILLPVKLVLTILNLLLAFIVAKVATCGLKKADYDILHGEPLARWRLCVTMLLAPLCRLQLFLLGYYWIRVKGRCASRTEAPMLVSNHVSGLVEGFYLWKYAKLAEASFLSNPLLGALMLATQGILVDREDPNSRHSAKAGLKRRATEERWPQTLVFPEGVCTNGKMLVQFKQGAFSTGVPVQPVIFRHSYTYHDSSFTHPLSAPAYLLGLFLQFVNYMEVEYLPVYVPSAEERENPALFAAHVQQVMANALDVPTTKHASEDVALTIAAQKLHMPMEAGVLHWQAVTEQLTGVNLKDAKEVLRQFRDLDTKGEGRLDFDSFKVAMHQQQATLSDDDLRSIFDLLDTGHDGYVDFAEYFCGVAVLNGHGSDEEVASLKFVFDTFAHGQSEFTKEQLGVILCKGMPTLEPEKLDELFNEADRDHNGKVSQAEFIAFAQMHKSDLNIRASQMLSGLPMSMASGTPRASA